MSDDGTEKFVDYYRLFDVKPNESLAKIRSRYIALAKQSHPDAGGSNEAMQLINRAYRTLADSTSRAAYDMMHGFRTGRNEQHYQYASAPESGGLPGNDEYIDMFLDQVYNELSSLERRAKGKGRFWKLFS